ncbi:UNVERIFIED_CONTAM: hypothetical protein RKD50_004549 [Streptomyces canus]
MEVGPIDSRHHHMAEETPEELVSALRAFWANAGHLTGAP